MRGSSFTIHLDSSGMENFTENFTSNEESDNEIPQGTQLRPTSQVSFISSLLRWGKEKFKKKFFSYTLFKTDDKKK